MIMEQKLRCVEVRTTDGKPILNLHLVYGSDGSGSQSASNKGQTGQASMPSSNDSSMTDAQRRYLFRLLAEQGLEENQAHERLKGLFGVESLQEVSKAEASAMIERLLEKS
jgi:hypothetical protein